MQVALETLDIQFNRQWGSLPRALGDPSILVWSFTPIIDSTDSPPEPNLEINSNSNSNSNSTSKPKLKLKLKLNKSFKLKLKLKIKIKIKMGEGCLTQVDFELRSDFPIFGLQNPNLKVEMEKVSQLKLTLNSDLTFPFSVYKTQTSKLKWKKFLNSSWLWTPIWLSPFLGFLNPNLKVKRGNVSKLELTLNSDLTFPFLVSQIQISKSKREMFLNLNWLWTPIWLSHFRFTKIQISKSKWKRF